MLWPLFILPMTILAMGDGQVVKRGEEIDRQFKFCCEAMVASCKACKLKQTTKEYCQNNPSVQGCGCTTDMKECLDGTRLSRDANCAFPMCPEEKPPECESCVTWFDGCSTHRASCVSKKTTHAHHVTNPPKK